MGASFVGIEVKVVVPYGKAKEAVEFYKEAFGAEEMKCKTHSSLNSENDLPDPILCAQLKIGSSTFLVCDQPDASSPAVKAEMENGIFFRMETEDVVGALARAMKAGAKKVGEVIEEACVCTGVQAGTVIDPFGVAWTIASISGSSSSNKCC
ncbi:Glyoxalase/Bleomycin resistance protein/Dihydroxybiphenyl dioxygenase protein [Dioscorea alata]|uniref:Glyoxalase/Bleomycin resistance protein/Dihydroxybiphenyl dioxygenase protein n=1 Tax=Dioscorea alata TaxID=55571 RepID=A0ACB7VA20_DIOAL|nr:Glyoxalase/Bleomycin resistance protein/Dihydroxybiphenyl dioxygenase protein [Dioscorea alata]